MEYVYSAMLLHSAEKDINEENVKKVLKAAGVKADAAKIKVLVASLEDVDIEEAIKTAAVGAAPSQPATTTEVVEEKKEEAKEEKEEEKTEEEAASGLAALFG